MGRYLANGVLTRFDIIEEDGWYKDRNFNIEQNLENILKDISDIIDPCMYELVKKEENRYSFALKSEIFNKNIYGLIREISPLTCPSDLENDLKKKNIDIYSKEFIEKYHFNVKVNEKGEYFLETNDYELEEDYPFYPLYWIMKDRKLSDKVEICAAVIQLWSSIDKYDGDDEMVMLRIINNMKAKYYSNPLSKALIYYISG